MANDSHELFRKIDELNPDEVQTLRSSLELDKARISATGGGGLAPLAAEAGAEPPEKVVLVAQGDSWFDYPPGLDLIYWLEKEHNYYIENFATAGDTLENMVYGTKFSESNWRRYPCRMNEVIEKVAKLRPKGVLFSAVGNDFAGDPLDSYFNHASSNLPPERNTYMDYMFDHFFFDGYCDFIERICAAYGTTPGKDKFPVIVGHNYANAIPDGRAVVNFAGFRFFGPWLRPTFTKKDLVDLASTIGLVKNLIGRLEDMLAKIRKKYPDNFDYVDFRPLVTYDDWANELHLKNSAYRRCASELAARLKAHGI